jgi:hypothetical protein
MKIVGIKIQKLSNILIIFNFKEHLCNKKEYKHIQIFKFITDNNKKKYGLILLNQINVSCIGQIKKSTYLYNKVI